MKIIQTNDALLERWATWVILWIRDIPCIELYTMQRVRVEEALKTENFTTYIRMIIVNLLRDIF